MNSLKRGLCWYGRLRSKRLLVRKSMNGSYPSIDQMWEDQLNSKRTSGIVDPIGSLQNWYSRAKNYWNVIAQIAQSAEATYDGVLNGYGSLTKIDIAGSRQFLQSYLKENSSFLPGRVLDCGAGIGRIAKEMLCSIFQTVDLIDQCGHYIEKAKKILAGKNVGHFYAEGLQNFTFEQKYDCIWIQWVLAHLTDQDAKQFLQKAKQALNDNGIIIVKENHTDEGFMVDKEDCSVARHRALYMKLFEEAKLRVIKEQIQKDWPKQLLEVRMYLLQ